jgi:hypothetical protein
MRIFLLLLLFTATLGHSQTHTDTFYVWQTYSNKNQSVESNTYTNHRNYFFTVPEGKYWIIMESLEYGVYFGHLKLYGHYEEGGSSDVYLYEDNAINESMISTYEPSGTQTLPYIRVRYGKTRILAGTEFFLDPYKNNQQNRYIKYLIYEYTLNDNSLTSNEIEIKQNNSKVPVLFPNPTSSLLALNSDKEYDIEVYDMTGNKVMVLTGNTIDMSHLSSATYIVKALDKVENEEVSYKVVKN